MSEPTPVDPDKLISQLEAARQEVLRQIDELDKKHLEDRELLLNKFRLLGGEPAVKKGRKPKV